LPATAVAAASRTAAVFDRLATAEATALILEANQPGRSSADVQSVFVDHALALGFASEAQGLFADSLSNSECAG